jgi:predicted RNA binding protein YcfA (HicA-like mRNA interferase family)
LDRRCILEGKLGREAISVKVRDFIKLIEADGWRHDHTTGSHRHYEHPIKKGAVSVSGKLGDEIPIGTLKKMFKQAQIKQQRGK